MEALLGISDDLKGEILDVLAKHLTNTISGRCFPDVMSIHLAKKRQLVGPFRPSWRPLFPSVT